MHGEVRIIKPADPEKVRKYRSKIAKLKRPKKQKSSGPSEEQAKRLVDSRIGDELRRRFRDG